jgi:AcrR family transcriptional regulator
MDKHKLMIANASRIFDAEGFRGVGIDRLIAPSGVSTRTLYKHFGSRDGLVVAVLQARHEAFMQQLEAEYRDEEPIGSVFDSLRRWLVEHGAQGCMLLRARSEYAAANQEIVALVQRQKREFRAEIARRVRHRLGEDNERLSNQIWLLFEGATASASVAPLSVIDDAKDATLSLIANAQAQRR